MDISAFITRVKGFLSEVQVVTEKEGLSHFCYDATELRFMPDVVVLPSSTEQVSKILKLSYEYDVPFAASI